MEKIRKLGLFGLILASLFLVSCASTDDQESGDESALESDGTAGSSGSTEVTPAGEVDISQGSGSGDMPSASTQSLDDLAKSMKTYYFAFDDSTLNEESRKALNTVAKILKATGTKVRLEGHADERGTREYNLALGERRAKSVANYLAIQGVPRSQLETISYGEEKPAVAASNEAAWAKNRRVELTK